MKLVVVLRSEDGVEKVDAVLEYEADRCVIVSRLNIFVK